MTDFLFPALLSALFVIILFLALREVNLWYFKINERIKLLESSNSELKTINENAARQNELLFILICGTINSKKISLIDRTSGSVKTISLSGIKNIDLSLYDIELLDDK